MANNLTTKEVDFLSDLLTFEESACKKAKIYSKTITDPVLSEAMSTLASNHEKRFEMLLQQLS
jgi:hypothetical protein